MKRGMNMALTGHTERHIDASERRPDTNLASRVARLAWFETAHDQTRLAVLRSQLPEGDAAPCP